MGKFSGKLLTVYISPSGVRVVEGENKNGNPDITRFFTVHGVSEYFTYAGSDSSNCEISNMSGLVNAIVTECKNQHTSSRRVLVCSDCFGVTTTISTNGLSGLKEILTADFRDLGKLLSPGIDAEPVPPDKMACDLLWGDQAIDGVMRQVRTRSIADKFLLTSLVQQFYMYGYEVIFISGAREVLMNFRQTEECSFDSQGKIIVNMDTECSGISFFKDVPKAFQSLPMMEIDQLLERVVSVIEHSLRHTGRNPRIYLSGAVFRNTEFYCRCIDHLENLGYTVFDFFGHPDLPENYEEAVASGEIDPVFTPDYSANLAMLLCASAKVLVSLTPKVKLLDVVKKNSKVLATAGLVAAIAFFIYASAIGVETLLNEKEMRDNPTELQDLQQHLMTLNSRYNNLSATVNTLTRADVTVLEVMKFVESNQSILVHVVTVDTADMLTNQFNVSTESPDYADDGISGESGGAASLQRKSIIIRGYAKSGSDAISYYNFIFMGEWPCDPTLNGIERQVLPNGEEVYVFEIEIGGGDLYE